MQQQDALDNLLVQLFSSAESDNELSQNLLAQNHATAIAQSRTLVQELGSLSTLFTEEPSMLEQKTSTLLTCEECRTELDGYVEAWLSGQDRQAGFPAVHDHLATCVDCWEQATMLFELLETEAAPNTVPAPTYLTFGQARQQTGVSAAPSLWQRVTEQVTEGIYQLSVDIPIVIEETKAIFGQLGAGLTPQLVPATSLRSSGSDGESMTELLELPHTECDLLIKVRMGTVVQDMGALALQLTALSSSQPLIDIKVSLREDDGTLLESIRSDQDGLAFFDELDTGKYQLQIEYAEQTWLVGLTVC